MIERQLIDLENFDPRTTTDPARILDLKHQIYDLRLELTHLKHLCELLDSFKQESRA